MTTSCLIDFDILYYKPDQKSATRVYICIDDIKPAY